MSPVHWLHFASEESGRFARSRVSPTPPLVHPLYREASGRRLGTFFHFVVAFSATAVYCLASSRLFFLINHPFVYGPLYGIAVHLFMTFAVLPLSAAKRPFSLSAFLIQFMIHMFAVGLSIALVARHFLQ
jgi:hypothetical protein